MSFKFLPLSKGGSAIVDFIDFDKVKSMKWHVCHRGVGSWDGNQLILLHGMIVPYLKCSFKNGNKLDCRRENIFKTHSNRKGLNIYDFKAETKFVIHRKVIENGQKYIFYTGVCYGQKKTKEEAFEKAKKVREEIFSMSRDEFLNFVKNRPTKKVSYSEIISDWDQSNDRKISNAEMFQMGISHVYVKR